jgi:hypothetical protein
MVILTTSDRERLAAALIDGGLFVVTHRGGIELDGAVADLKWLRRLCSGGFLRLVSISGDRNNPMGERRYDYELTAKGRSAVGQKKSA